MIKRYLLVLPLNKIAEQVRHLIAELEAGETPDNLPYELGMIARRIDAQAEMLALEKKAET